MPTVLTRRTALRRIAAGVAVTLAAAASFVAWAAHRPAVSLAKGRCSGGAKVTKKALVRTVVNPRDEVFFAGKIDPLTLSFFERMAVKLIKSPVGDKRDSDRIRRWTDGLRESLQ